MAEGVHQIGSDQDQTKYPTPGFAAKVFTNQELAADFV